MTSMQQGMITMKQEIGQVKTEMRKGQTQTTAGGKKKGVAAGASASSGSKNTAVSESERVIELQLKLEEKDRTEGETKEAFEQRLKERSG